MGIKVSEFGKTSKGKIAHIYTLVNGKGMALEVTDYGATMVSILAPDAKGRSKDVLLGYDDVQDYEQGTCYFGAIIGRNGNRTKDAQVVIDGHVYQMEKNEGENNLHSGSEGYSNIIWDASVDEDGNSVSFHHVGADGEQGLPGTFDITVTYTLTMENEVKIHYEGTSDKDTIANMTNHGYYNLAGHAAGKIEDHILWLDADAFTPVGQGMIPTGEILPVEGTPMDFRTATPVGARIDDFDFVQLKNGNGYDHNWVLNTQRDITHKCVTLESPKTGIVLDVYTNEPGIQVYAGNFLDGTIMGKKGIVYNQRASVCLETQKYPDTPNKPDWPSAVLRPGEKYNSHCVFKFSIN